MNSGEFTELIPGLPEEIALECLTRLHYTTHRVASGVCKRWRELIQSTDFYYHRKKTGKIHIAGCLVQSLPGQPDPKPIGHPNYGITVFDSVNGTWDRIDPISKYPNGLPLLCQVASTEGKLVVMGGWDPNSWEPVKDVFLFDFTAWRWTQCKEMPATRSFFAMASVGGRVFVAGGHDEGKNALKSAWVFDIGANEWTELAQMSEERDECEGVIIGSEFWVVSGYGTDNQGRFKSSAESMDLKTGEWRLTEDVWVDNRCPRSSVGVGKSGNLLCLAGSDPAVRFGTCGVDFGDRTLVCGSGYQGGPHGFFLMENKEGQNGKLVRLEVDDEFSGIVHSGCSVEI